MNIRCTLFIALYIITSQVRAQLNYGLGVAIHRYDQVLSFKTLKPLDYGALGADLGLGVERSLQGALAPQLALYFQAPFSEMSFFKKVAPCYSLRYQFDFQKASFLDAYHGVYIGAGLAFGRHKNLSVCFSSGLVLEQLYLTTGSGKSAHIFWNPQAQISYFIKKPE